MNRQYETRNQIFHRVYQTASFIKHQHLQGFKFNLNRAGEIGVTLRIQLLPKVFPFLKYQIIRIARKIMQTILFLD